MTGPVIYVNSKNVIKRMVLLSNDEIAWIETLPDENVI